jgi:hypothetical protein
MAFYEKHEHKLSLAFFLGGFLFDIFTLSDIDDPLSIAQQVAYLAIMALVLGYDFIHGEEGALQHGPKFARKAWAYRMLLFHFVLGSLLSVYSLFFLKSASFFSSAVFVAMLLALMVGNELKSVQQSGIDFKIALFVITVFCFFSMMVPIVLGFVGRVPFLLALLLTLGCLWAFYRFLKGRVGTILLRRRLLAPGAIVAVAFTVFYLVGWIPPVPLSIQKMGIYHGVAKAGDAYQLQHQNPWWKFWRYGDQDFRARPGDKVYFFAGIFSPARFDDSIFIRWSQKNPRLGWQSSDRIPLHVTGGRRGGYRGFTMKQNYGEGDWRVSVETSDGREIGRMYFTITREEAGEPREFFVEKY